MFFKMTG